jgi:hypothetical protein
MRGNFGRAVTLTGIAALALLVFGVGRIGGHAWTLAADDSALPPKRLAPPPTSADERAERDAIDKLYNNRGGSPLDQELPLGGITRDLTFDFFSFGSPLPFAESSITVLGTVTDYQPFLSGDKRSIYTEITVKVEEVLRAKPGFNVRKNDHLTITRMDGSAVLPNGRVVTFLVHGVGNPLPPGRRYVLFLSRHAALPRYGVATAWELRGGHVLAANVWCTAEEIAELTALTEKQFLRRVRSESRRK